MTKNAKPNKYFYSGYGTGFNAHGFFFLSSNSSFGKNINIIIFGADMNSPVHIDNKKKDISILGKGPTRGLDNTILTTEKEYSVNFNEQQNKF